jgi:hypothetical protein
MCREVRWKDVIQEEVVEVLAFQRLFRSKSRTERTVQDVKSTLIIFSISGLDQIEGNRKGQFFALQILYSRPMFVPNHDVSMIIP